MSAQRSLTLSRLILLPSSPSIGCFGFELEEACNILGLSAASGAGMSERSALSHFGTR